MRGEVSETARKRQARKGRERGLARMGRRGAGFWAAGREGDWAMLVDGLKGQAAESESGVLDRIAGLTGWGSRKRGNAEAGGDVGSEPPDGSFSLFGFGRGRCFMGKRMTTMDDDDAQLLRRYARQGAEEAFAELVRRHLGLVYGSALRRVNGNAALAEEVAQEVFAGAAKESERLAGKVEGGVSLAGWLYVTTRNAAANVVRAERRRVRREQEAFAISERGTSGGADATGASGVASMSEEEMWARVRPELEAVMDNLGEKDREVVLLRFFEGRAFGEIGTALRVSEDAARVRVNRALEKLRGIAEMEDPESSVVPILVDAILLVESYRGARHQITFLDDLTDSVDGLLRELTIVEKSKLWAAE